MSGLKSFYSFYQGDAAESQVQSSSLLSTSSSSSSASSSSRALGAISSSVSSSVGKLASLLSIRVDSNNANTNSTSTVNSDRNSTPASPSATAAALASVKTELDNYCSMSYGQRMCVFAMAASAGCVLLAMSFLSVSSLLIGRPHKFAVTYTLANVLLIASSCFLVGPQQQMANMFSSSRFTASIIYVVSLLATLYCTWQLNHFYIIFPVLLVQFGALLWYVASYFPYGRSCLSGVSTSLFRRSVGI